MIDEKVSQVARKYTRIPTQTFDVTHCLDDGEDYFFCPDFAWFSAVEGSDMSMLVEVYHEVKNRFVGRFPEDYGVLKEKMLPSLRHRAQKIASRIDQLYALPQRVSNRDERKSRLHELRRLLSNIESLVEEHDESTRLSEVFPKCIEFRFISSENNKSDLSNILNGLKGCVIYEQADFYPTFTFEMGYIQS